MSYRLYLDDIRVPESSHGKFGLSIYLEPWVIVRNFDDFVSMIQRRGLPDVISFDHDLDAEHTEYYFENGGHTQPPDPLHTTFTEKTGYDCAKWLIDYCLDNNKELPAYLIHSANPVGTENIKNLLKSFPKP